MKTNKTERNCGTCRYADFERTASGRIRRGTSGACKYPLPELPALPRCVDAPTFYRCGIWPELGNCPTWSPKGE